jgi:hypothetical protein
MILTDSLVKEVRDRSEKELMAELATGMQREELEGLSRKGIALLRDMAVVEGEDALYREAEGTTPDKGNEIRERDAMWKKIRDTFAKWFG